LKGKDKTQTQKTQLNSILCAYHATHYKGRLQTPLSRRNTSTSDF